MRRPYQVLLLAAVVLLAFYPVHFAGYFPIDDAPTFAALQQQKEIPLIDLFRPVRSDVGYYRPVLFVSYVIDKYLFDLHPQLMHLENVLFHLFNAVLIFLLVGRLLPRERRSASYAPLVAALLFALHPLTSESVNWISGRTDLLAGTFVLVSTLYLLKFGESRSLAELAVSLAAFAAGAMTKEFVIAYLPAAVFLVATDDGVPLNGRTAGPVEFVRANRDRIVFVILTLTSVGCILFLQHARSLAFPRRLQLTLLSVGTNPIHSVFVLLGSLGFYVKKLFIPYPLNFAILEVDPLYVLLGVPAVLSIIYCARTRSTPAAFLTIGMFLLMPYFVISFGQIAWTPYAERYLYLPLAFFVISMVLFCEKHSQVVSARVWKIAVALILVVFSFMTVERSVLWMDESAIVADTVGKSPRSRDMRILYGYLLARKGDFSNALAQIEAARRLPMTFYNDKADVMMAHVLEMMGRREDALDMSMRAWEQSGGTSIAALKNILSLTEDRLLAAVTAKDKRECIEQLSTYSAELFRLTHDARVLYRTASYAELTGNTGVARAFYQKALLAMSDDDMYRSIAGKRLQALAKEDNVH